MELKESFQINTTREWYKKYEIKIDHRCKLRRLQKLDGYKKSKIQIMNKLHCRIKLMNIKVLN